jgi:hypothetical protein
MYLLFIGPGRNDFDATISIMRALERVGPEIETFLGPEMATSEASAIWAQKVKIFRAHLFQRPVQWICLLQNKYKLHITKTGA